MSITEEKLPILGLNKVENCAEANNRGFVAFVYLWSDAKTNRKYIGVHKGSVNDGYVCSSTVMMAEYKQRPADFTREILFEGSRAECYAKEHELLKEVNARYNPDYYNQTNGGEKWYLPTPPKVFVEQTIVLFRGTVVYHGAETMQFHEQNYLSTTDEALPFFALHALMRKQGIDWFTSEPGRMQIKKPLKPEHKKKISETMKKTNLRRRGQRTGLYHWKDKKNGPHTHSWMVTTSNDFTIVENLKDWCRTVGVPYSAIIGKIRYNSWPYVAGRNLNIQSIRRYSK